MDTQLMNLKILLPFKVFADVQNVKRIVAETSAGEYGFLPQRLDCVAALVPGILMYESTTGGIKYVAVDKGVMVKEGENVMVSLRNAISGSDLGDLHKQVETEFIDLDDNEKNTREIMAKMESSFMLQLQKFQRQ